MSIPFPSEVKDWGCFRRGRIGLWVHALGVPRQPAGGDSVDHVLGGVEAQVPTCGTVSRQRICLGVVRPWFRAFNRPTAVPGSSTA